MRNAFIQTLLELAREDERVWLLTGDLGFSVLEPFAQEFPERYVNMGVAEQNMTGVAAGLAHSGKIVFTYSIANFPVIRCLEQIRNDVCYHNLNVKVVSVGGGFSYGSLGYTHHGIEDLAVMRAMPNMTVIAPGDPVETLAAVRAMVAHEGPCYLRLGKAGEPVVHETEPDFQLGRAIRMAEGEDVALISTGGMLKTVMRVRELLAEKDISALVYSMHTLSSMDEEAIQRAAGTRLIATVEEHSPRGGLFGAVSEAVAPLVNSAPLISFHAGNRPIHTVGDQDYLRTLAGLAPEHIAAAIYSRLNENGD